MQRRKRNHSAFTLVELMISIAIVLVLMLGINFVFSMSARTISGGMAISAVARDIRNSRRVMEQDFGNAVGAEEMPAVMIHSEYIYTWRDKQDKLADRDGDPWTYDIDGDSNNGDEVNLQPGGPTTSIPAAHPLRGLYNFRKHRLDRISFFVRHNNDRYTRQTGDDTTYVGPETSDEAWIWYGLLRLPGNHPTDPTLNGLTYWKPGGRGDPVGGVFPDERGNPNNFFASQWILGRKVLLLKSAANLTALNNIYYENIQIGSQGKRIATANTAAVDYDRPTATYSNPPAGREAWEIQESRIDLVGWRIADYLPLFSASPPSWFVDADPTNHTTATANRDYRSYQTALPGALSLNYLFCADPFVSKANNAVGPSNNFAQSMEWQTRQAAQTTPIFVRGCMQFIVEFAGDFYDQGPIAGVPEPLGTIDYIPDLTDTTITTIRWYGLPRDVHADLATPGIERSDVNLLTVAPELSTGGGAGTPRFSSLGMQKVTPAPAMTDTPDAPYVWAWLPPTGAEPIAGIPSTPGDPTRIRPKLIRITVELIDANGRLQDGQRIEYLFSLK